MFRTGSIVPVILLCILIPAAGAAPAPVFTISYAIHPAPDGSALWNVEYRALLPTQDDVTAFERDIAGSSAIPADEVRQVMERSAGNAAAATGRVMEIKNFSYATAVQTTPTGTYGVIRYTFLWTGFALGGNGMTIGDAFTGGLYLSKETTLTILPPQGYRVMSATPPPDLSRDDLTWYGLRSFEPGEPRVVMAPPVFPWLEAAIAVLIFAAVGTGSAVFVIRRQKAAVPAASAAPPAPDQAAKDLASLEDRIVQLLKESGGELYQSEITARLGAPKSTVSSALAGLHEKHRIVKVRKGRENLIRLV